MKTKHLIIAISCLTGCASFSPQLGFDEVSKKVSERTGKNLYWNDGSERDKEIRDEVSKLLASPLNVDSATQIALLNNRGLQATYQSLGIAQADLVEAGLLPNPILGGDIRFRSEGANFELSLVENVVAMLEIPLRKKIAESEFEEAKIRVISQVLELTHQVRKEFYQYQGNKQMLEVAKTALAALDASRVLAQKLHDAGNFTDLELAQEQSNYEVFKIGMTSVEEQVVESREKLNILMGLGSEQINWSTQGRLPEFEPLEVDYVATEKKALENSLELAEANQRLVTLATYLGLAEDFRLIHDGELGLSANKESEGKWGFGPAFSIPIPLFSQGKPQIFRTNAELSRQYDICADLTVHIQSAIRATIAKLNLVSNRIKYQREGLIPIQTKLVKETQRQYNGMLTSAFELIEAKGKQIEYGQKYVNDLTNYWILRADLESLTNGILPKESNL